MKKIILLALCMLVLGSGAAMADSWPDNGVSIYVFESTYFNNIALFNFPGQSAFNNPALSGSFGYSVPIPLGDGSIFWGNDGSWHVITGDDGTTASGTALTSMNFYVNPAGTTDTPLQFYFGVFENTTLVAYWDVEYVPHYFPNGDPQWLETRVPEPSLVLLLGIGLGAISLIVWRRVV